MENRDKIIKFCNDLNLGIIKIEYFRDKESSYYGDCKCSYYEVELRLPFNYKGKFRSDLSYGIHDRIEDWIGSMFDDIEVMIVHILNRNLTH